MQNIIKLIILKQVLSYEIKKPDESVQDYYNRLVVLADELLQPTESVSWSAQKINPNDIIM